MLGVDVPDREAAYSASKAAALQLARSVTVDCADRGIRSNAVLARIPLGRVAQPSDIADAIALLASGRLAYMTGAALVVDGGWTAV